MNDELQQALADIILKATETVGAAKDFVLAEMPDVVHQLLAWEMTRSLLYCLLSLALFASIILYWRWVWGHRAEDWMDANEFGGPLVGVGAVLTVVAVIPAFVVFNLTWLQILIAPKIYLIEYAASLVR